MEPPAGSAGSHVTVRLDGPLAAELVATAAAASAGSGAWTPSSILCRFGDVAVPGELSSDARDALIACAAPPFLTPAGATARGTSALGDVVPVTVSLDGGSS
jgi:hypothetical protein